MLDEVAIATSLTADLLLHVVDFSAQVDSLPKSELPEILIGNKLDLAGRMDMGFDVALSAKNNLNIVVLLDVIASFFSLPDDEDDVPVPLPLAKEDVKFANDLTSLVSEGQFNEAVELINEQVARNDE